MREGKRLVVSLLNVNLILSYLERCRKTMPIYNVICDFNILLFSVVFINVLLLTKNFCYFGPDGS